MTARHSFESVKRFVESNGYALLSTTYESNTKKIRLKHIECNREFDMAYKNFYSNGQRCPFCGKEKVCRDLASKQKLSIEDVKLKIEKKASGEYTLVSKEYKGVHSKLEILHNKCGNIFSVSLNDFQKESNRGCPRCSLDNRKLSIDEIIEFIRNKTGEEYELLSTKYEGVHGLLTFRHFSELGCHEFEMRFNDFRNGQRCPVCQKRTKTSSQVAHVENALKDLGLQYIKEATLFDGKKFRVDYYIIDLKLSIEFDGVQHFGIKGNLKEDAFLLPGIKRDWMKNFLHQKNRVSLLRIPFTFKKEEIYNAIVNAIKREVPKMAYWYCANDNKVYNDIMYFESVNPNYFKNHLDLILEANEEVKLY